MGIISFLLVHLCCFTSYYEPYVCSRTFKNIFKKKYYYIDPTWGDWSTNLQKKDTDDLVIYDYCCVPYREFIMASPEGQHNHIPRKAFYPNMKQKSGEIHAQGSPGCHYGKSLWQVLVFKKQF